MKGLNIFFIVINVLSACWFFGSYTGSWQVGMGTLAALVAILLAIDLERA